MENHQNRIGFLERMVCTIGLQAATRNLLSCIVAAGDALRSQTGNIMPHNDGGMYTFIAMTALLLLIVSVSGLLWRSYAGIIIFATIFCYVHDLRVLCGNNSRLDCFTLTTKALIILLLTYIVADIVRDLGVTGIISGLAILAICYGLYRAFEVDQMLNNFAAYCVESLLQFMRSALGPAQFDIDCITDGYPMWVQP